MPGKIIRKTLATIKEKIRDISEIEASEVRIGLGYTGVMLNTGHVGVSHTLLDDIPKCCQVVKQAGKLAGNSALQIAELVKSWDPIEATLGVATLNALSQMVLEEESSKYSITENANFIEHVGIKEEDTVVLVGTICPFIPLIKERAKSLLILERDYRLRVGEEMLPDTACEEVFPKADVVIITGSTLVNGTIDRLLYLCKSARAVGLAGPTASILPDHLFEHGVTITGGIKVVDAQGILRVISEGGGVPQFKGTCRQIIIRQGT